MNRRILVFLSFVLVLSVLAVSSLSAGPDGQLQRLFESGKTLFFDTSNVTVAGHAEFTLDGERFKTADILYKQDDTFSHWQLDLLTPRPGREDRETGYTIIANGDRIYIMEKYNPGRYATASDEPCSTLVRQSAGSDLLVSMAYALAGPIEALLPEDAVVSSESDEGTQVQITLQESSVPSLLNPLMNLAAQFVLRRFMGVEADHIADWGVGPFNHYLTVTEGIIYTTSSYNLSDTAVTVSLDQNGRLTAVRGTADVILESKREPKRTLSVSFDFSVSGYGQTYVPAFDAGDFGVVPAV